MALKIIFGVIGGLGLFLYGMNLMGAGLQKAAGDRLRKIIELLTSNKYMGALVGLFVTAIIQSSSATTVMVVGFVNAGIMNLTQAVGVIMGANIGTTVTAQLVSFSLTDFAPIAVGIGMIFYLFSSNEKTKQIAEIMIGFGILFIGMEFLKDAVKPLRDYPGFGDMIIKFSHNPILGILIGFGLTVIVQSSSASMGILLALASEGLIPLSSALPILYGENIGTCITAMLSSIGASKNAKRAAIMHLSFNVIGTTLFIFLLTKPITYFVTMLDPTNAARQIANAHTLFNISNVVIQLPFAMLLVKIANLVIPEKEGEEVEFKVTKYIDSRILETPSIALANTIRECLHMGNVAKRSFKASMEGFFNRNTNEVKSTFTIEKEVNELEKALVDYLVKLSNKELGDENREIVDGLFSTVNDIERVGDHAENIAELAMEVLGKNLLFSNEAIGDLEAIYNKTMQAYEAALEAMKTGNRDIAMTVIGIEDQVDAMERSFRMNHIYRLNKGLCNPEAGVIFLDMISNLERIADHASNIAKAVLDSVGSKSA
ncbi:sodium-dependent phosphate transporter [Peptoclostridium acidaminophilum DSM 3953]|uniref:Sodium-dependent phosphate transporter n=1 Tax=Peptoclostridium acidaminophilum DSM 3953 TaxID=1286171 RepID=W8U7Q5_PEPAC|nr:Na/Pi cotransporter family protein [Peptoclostridium acidaminophilum]AHM56911.1 sodium-dependent phosphate transporter [Peptoclostridium acidaminophilum DSM 3953]